MINDTIFQKLAPAIQSRWFSFENIDGKKGEGGKANFGRKGAPCKIIKPGDDMMYFHSYWRRENFTKAREDFIGTGWGQGQFADMYQGCQYQVQNDDGLFYGFYRFHVPDPIYFHKDIKVTIQALGGGWAEQILNDMKNNPKQKFMKAGKGGEFFKENELFFEEKEKYFFILEREDDFCSTAYWYMDSPTNSLPKLATVKERIINLPK